MSPPRFWAFAGVLVVLASRPAGAAGPLYSLIDMGHAPGYTSVTPTGINSSGYVVGSVGLASTSTYTRGFVWNPNTHVYTLVGNGASSSASGINDRGIVVGTDNVTGNTAYRYNLNTGVITHLSPMPGGSSANAVAINASGAVTGRSLNAILQYRAPLWAPGASIPSDLGALPGDGRHNTGYDINDAGVVVGQSKPGNNVVPVRATRWDPTTHQVLDLGTLGGLNSLAYAINNPGFIVGSSNIGGGESSHPFLWNPTTQQMTDLGLLPGAFSGRASDINDSNMVVGHTGFNVGDPLNRAYLWTSQTGMLDLNTLTDFTAAGWVLNSAVAINNAGWITGYGRAPDGHQHGFVLVPVPEPATISLLILGALGTRRVSHRNEKRSSGWHGRGL